MSVQPIIPTKHFLLVCRYAYYCKAVSFVSDQEYDALEKSYLEENPHDKELLAIGSDNQEDYPFHIRSLFLYLRFRNACEIRATP